MPGVVGGSAPASGVERGVCEGKGCMVFLVGDALPVGLRGGSSCVGTKMQTELSRLTRMASGCVHTCGVLGALNWVSIPRHSEPRFGSW